MAVKKEKLLEDFGEKIGGARKDLWGYYGLRTSDLEEMNAREAERFVRKDNVWKKPDYEALIRDGVPIGVAYYIKQVRDSLYAAPNYVFLSCNEEAKREMNRVYVDTIQKLKGIVENVRTVEDCREAYSRFMEEAGLGNGDFAYHPALSLNTRTIMRVGNDASFEWKFTREAQRKQFGVNKEDKVPAGYFVRQNRKNGYCGGENVIAGTYYFGKGRCMIADNIPTREEAVRAAQEHAAASRKKNGKQKFIPPQLSHVERTGPDYRNGVHATGDDYLNTFGFRGGEFGNWLNQDDRQASLDMGFEALKDLAYALKISDQDISFGGKLAIAFGARGHGRAMAHYEPLRQVINLTKMHGAGSLAHEWWHSFDDYMGSRINGSDYLSDHPGTWQPMKELMNAIKINSHVITAEDVREREEKTLKKLQDETSRYIDAVFGIGFTGADAPEEIRTGYERRKADVLAGKPDGVTALGLFYKSVAGHCMSSDQISEISSCQLQIRLNHSKFEILEGRTEVTETQYYKNSQRIGKFYSKDGGYWDSNVEMTARAFACYVMDRLNMKSDYLVGHAESAVALILDRNGDTKAVPAYPQREERERIDKAFDRIFEAAREEGVFTYQAHPEPLARKAVHAAASVFAPAASARTELPDLSEDKYGQMVMFA